jgi:hypothetical protein
VSLCSVYDTWILQIYLNLQSFQTIMNYWPSFILQPVCEATRATHLCDVLAAEGALVGDA